ncbi:nuclear transport factor 2 family protein [Amycolatopsis sp. K13G38]|uniref:Nuclear transport factor 2 family protein n=1 Tax=Amycolatopsis acididurans TaxID=2724524 RepID=A0ABX1JHG8_9PSEU|nr:nuclear transport factor 2 family protein [Amycolatopsis acididurans]
MSARPRETVEAFLNAFKLKDVDAAMSNVADDAKVTVFPLQVRGGGADVVRTLLEDVVTSFPDLLITVKDVIEVGRVVVAEFKIEGTQSADFLGAINQEKHLDLDTAWRFTVEGDHLAGIDAYWCQNQLYRRLAVKRQDHVTIV